MSKSKTKSHKPEFIEVNFKVLAFKHPSVFEERTAGKLLRVFRENALRETYYLTFDELYKQYNKLKDPSEKAKDSDYKRYLTMTNWQKKDQDDGEIIRKIKDESEKTAKENLRILSQDGIVRQVNTIYIGEDSLRETKKYVLWQNNFDLIAQAKSQSKDKVVQFVLSKIESSNYPFSSLVELDKIFTHISDQYFELNHLVYQLISENQMIRVPLLKDNDDKIQSHDYLLPGKLFSNEMNHFIDYKLIPALQIRYPLIVKDLENLMGKNNFTIREGEITKNNRKKVFQLCFMVLQSKKHSAEITLEDHNLAQLILNSWLSLENDPLMALKEFPEIELDDNFLSPFLSHYIQDLSHIAEYLKLLKGFMDHLPQVIEREDLTNFFKSRGLQKKVVETFLNHPPEDIISLKSNKHQYVVAKGQIVKAICYLHNENYYKATESGQQQFEVLGLAFATIEKSSKDYNVVLSGLKTTHEGFSEAKEILQNSENYRSLQDGKEKERPEASPGPVLKEIRSSLSGSKLYSSKDFEKLDDEDREKLFVALNLMVIDCVDHKDEPYTFYIKRTDLTMDDARFLRGKPTYEMLAKRFNL